jgi:hypothetical protein
MAVNGQRQLDATRRDITDQRIPQKLVLKNEAIDAIVRVLKAREFNDSRKLDDRALPLKNYVVAEVGRSFDRVRLEIPDNHPLKPPRVTAAAMRQQGKLWLRWPGLRQLAGVSELWAKIYSKAEQEPPEVADVFKHRCAAEAFDLLEILTVKGPTLDDMQTISGLLHGGEIGDYEMERTCKRVLQNRRSVPRNNPDIPPLGTPF